MNLTPTLKIGGINANGAVPKPSNIGSSFTLPPTRGPQIPNPLTGSMQPKTISQGSIQGMINIPQAPKATTPLKSTVVAHPSGITVTHNYSAPVPSYDAKTGFLTPAGVSAGKTATQTNDPANAPKTPPLTTAGQTSHVLDTGNRTTDETRTQENVIDKSNNPGQAYTDAQNKVKEVEDRLSAFDTETANLLKGTAEQGISLSSSRGQEANIAQARAAERDSITNELTTAQGQVGAANTNQGMQNTEANTAYAGSQTQAGRAAGVAGTVLGAVAPITGVPYGTQTIQPGMIGSSSSGTGQVQPNDPFYSTLQQAAQQAASGQYSAIPSSITSNPVLNAQMNDMAKKINPNYNPVTSAAQSGIATGQAQNVAAMTASYQSATNLGSQLKDLITTYGVNPSDLNAANLAIQKVAQNTSSSQYQALNNLVTDIVATYSSILTPGSSTDTAMATAASLLNDSASGKSLITTLNNLDDQAKAKIAGQTTSYGANPGAPSGGGTSTSGFGWIPSNIPTT